MFALVRAEQSRSGLDDASRKETVPVEVTEVAAVWSHVACPVWESDFLPADAF